ncbi:MAG: DUF5777 family beta-barrel protein [Bacteroidia bacterium]|nr:DUF5777 family beta-barrel protein [Bacteroidia bacterium]MDW8157527.1 DUF5777 family beta-barrel protein [Bacteroidia bacterium]
MKKFLLGCMFWGITLCCYAQEDEMNRLLEEMSQEPTSYTFATFKSTRVINGHSIETLRPRHLDFRISHRFGRLNQGLYDIFGLDNAVIRLGVDFCPVEGLLVGIGRNTIEKTYDGFIKYKLLRQAKGQKNIPITLAILGTMSYNTLKYSQEDPKSWLSSRITYTLQSLIARKFNEWFSLQLSPTYIHRNLVLRKKDANGIWALGIGGRIKITKRIAFNAEYFLLAPWQEIDAPDFDGNSRKKHNSLSLGFDIETGGHVFQLHFTNSRAMIEKAFIAETTESWGQGAIHFGFNISRVFSFDKSFNKDQIKDKSSGENKW